MADITERILIDDTQAIAALKNYRKELELVEKGTAEVADESKKAFASTAVATDGAAAATTKYTGTITAAATATTGNTRTTAVNTGAKTRNTAATTANTVAVGRSTKANIGNAASFQATSKSINANLLGRLGSFGRVLGGIGGAAAVIVLPLALAGAAIANFISRNQQRLDSFRDTVSGFASGFERFRDIFAGEFEIRTIGGVTDLLILLGSIGQAAEQGAINAGNLREAIRAVAESQVDIAALNTQISEQRAILADEDQPLDVKQTALGKYKTLLEDLETEEVGKLTTLLEAQKAALGEAFTDEDSDDYKNFLQLQVQIETATGAASEKAKAYFREQKRLNGEIATAAKGSGDLTDAQKEEAKSIEELTKLYADLAAGREDAISNIVDKIGDAGQKAADELKQAEIDAIIDPLKQLGEQELFDASLIQRNFDLLLAEADNFGLDTKELDQALKDSLEAEEIQFGIRRKQIVAGNNDAILAQYIQDADKAIAADEKIKQDQQDKQRDHEDKMQFIREQSVALGFKVLIGAFDQLAESRGIELEAQLDVLDAIQERAETVQDELQNELDLREEGLANNVEGKKRELEELAAEEAKAARKANELRKKQINAQFAADTAAQLSNVAVAATGFFASHANIPVVGFAVAAAFIGAMFGILSGIRSRAQALKQESFSEGGFIGQDGKPWRSDRYGRGHRVEDSNIVLGGDEYVINGRTTAKHRGFLDELNAGHYDNMNLAEGLKSGFRTRDQVIQKRRGRRDQSALDAAMRAAMSPLNKHLKQGQFYVYRQGDTVVHVTPEKIVKSKMN